MMEDLIQAYNLTKGNSVLISQNLKTINNTSL